MKNYYEQNKLKGWWDYGEGHAEALTNFLDGEGEH